jgi:hypothetical protein
VSSDEPRRDEIRARARPGRWQPVALRVPLGVGYRARVA